MTEKEQIKEFLFDLKDSNLNYYELVEKWEKRYIKEKDSGLGAI